MRRGPEPWHARAPFWVGLALTAVSGFVTLKVQIASLEARQAETPAQIRELDLVNARLAALEARCK